MRISVAFVALCAGAVACANASTNFTSRNAFDSFYPWSVVEDFDGLPSGAVLPAGTFANGIDYSTTGGDALVTAGFLNTTDPNGLGATNAGFFQASDTLTITFSQPIIAFGIDINTFTSIDGGYLAVTNTGEQFTSVFDVFPNEFTGNFLGFTADHPFTSVTLSAVSGGQSYTVDTIRAVVPAPGAALVLAGLPLASRRRR